MARAVRGLNSDTVTWNVGVEAYMTDACIYCMYLTTNWSAALIFFTQCTVFKVHGSMQPLPTSFVKPLCNGGIFGIDANVDRGAGAVPGLSARLEKEAKASSLISTTATAPRKA